MTTTTNKTKTPIIIPEPFHKFVLDIPRYQKQSVELLPAKNTKRAVEQYVNTAPVARAFVPSQGRDFDWLPGFARSFVHRVGTGTIDLRKVLVHWAARRTGDARFGRPIMERKVLDRWLENAAEERISLRHTLADARERALRCDPSYFLPLYPELEKIDEELLYQERSVEDWFREASMREPASAFGSLFGHDDPAQACRLILNLEQGLPSQELHWSARPDIIKWISEVPALRERFLRHAREDDPALTRSEVEDAYLGARNALAFQLLHLTPLFKD